LSVPRDPNEGPGFKAHGLAANLASLDFLEIQFSKTQHRVHNQRFTIEGDRAVGETYSTVDHLRVIGGYDSNDLVHIGGEWKLVLVKLTALWTRGDRSFMDSAAERGASRLERG